MQVVFHPERNLLASASYDNTIKLFREDPNDEDWVCCGTLTGHDSTVWSISFEGNGKRLASCSDDQTVKIWKEYPPGNPEGVATVDGDSTWKCVCTLGGHHGRTIYDISWCSKTGLMATACGDDAIRVFKESETSDPNAPSFDLVCTIDRAHNQDVNCVTWNPAVAGLLVSCSDDGEIKVWNFVDA